MAGRLRPVRRQRCKDCGARADRYHHHKGYEPEHWLTVIPLCASCHKRRHTEPVPPPPQFVVTTVRTPDDVYEELHALARQERRSLNATMVVAMEEYVRQMKARQPKDVPDAR